MRDIPFNLQPHLAKDATTLCLIWTLKRRDATTFGFTNHDRDLLIDGVTYSASSGLSAGAVDSRLGFAVDSGAVAGILSDERITPDDIAAGLYAGATLSMAVVNWQEPQQSMALATGFIGQIKQTGDAFELEWLGEGAWLDRSQGRVFSRQCDAEFGDARCGVNAADYPQGTTCPRSYLACHAQFSNARNFRGFPFLLGDDALVAAPQESDMRDGGSRFTGLLEGGNPHDG